MRRLWVLALCTLTACASAQTQPAAHSTASSARSATASPGAAPSPLLSAAYGVMLKYAPYAVPVDPGPVVVISLVATDGRVVAQATPAPRSGESAAASPFGLSASNSAVYFLDGDTTVRALTPDGRIQSITTVPGSDVVRSTFSVSPDDRRIAVATIDYSANPFKGSLYVEDVVGHPNHAEIYSTTFPSNPMSVPIFQPIGWHQGRIALYLANVTSFSGIHLIDAATAVRVLTACPDGWSSTGNLEPAGILCFRNVPGIDNSQHPDVAVESWTGELKVIPNTPYGPYCTGLSPHGTFVACSGTPLIVHRVADGSSVQVQASRVVLGWIDESHLLFAQDSPEVFAVLDITTGVAAPTTAKGFFAGTFPGGLD